MGCSGARGLWASSGLGLLIWKVDVIRLMRWRGGKKEEGKKPTQNRDDQCGAESVASEGPLLSDSATRRLA